MDVIHKIFIDIRLVFDGIIREELVKIMRKINIPGKFIRFTQITIKGSNAIIVTNKKYKYRQVCGKATLCEQHCLISQ